MSNDRYSAGALIQRLHGLMSCAGPEQRFNSLFNYFFSFFFVVARGWTGSAGLGEMPVVFSKAGWPWLV